MATKENKRQVRELVEALEQRAHAGPTVGQDEIQSARDFLRRNDFAPTSAYFHRLTHLESRLQHRPRESAAPRLKRNYGGKAAGYQMQVQSVFDHVLLSTCYEGDFNTRHGRVKISHRFNQEGRIDFVELKYLNSLHPPLNGEIRKLLTVKDFPSNRRDWFGADAHILKVLPQELVFLYDDIFRCPRAQIFAWLVNIGHGIVNDLVQDLQARAPSSAPLDLARPAASEPNLCWPHGARNHHPHSSVYPNGDGRAACLAEEPDGRGFGSSTPRSPGYPEQLRLECLVQDEVAWPILQKAAGLEAAVDMLSHTEVVVRYSRKTLC